MELKQKGGIDLKGIYWKIISALGVIFIIWSLLIWADVFALRVFSSFWWISHSAAHVLQIIVLHIGIMSVVAGALLQRKK